MMASQHQGPDAEDRENPGDTQTNPSGTSAEQPAEGSDDEAPEEAGSPNG
jgi:hypothetical protein